MDILESFIRGDPTRTYRSEELRPKLLSEDSKDIYTLLMGDEERKRRKLREELLHTVGVGEEYFKEGTVKIDKVTCRGVECKLCIKACPTNALYREEGEVKIEKDLCIYCVACVLSCIVDNCITVTRKRKNGETERFGTPREAILMMGRQAAQRREGTVKLLLEELDKAKLAQE